MRIIGPDELVFGVDDLPACRQFLADYGLDEVEWSDAGGTFAALDNTAITVRHRKDASLPREMASKSSIRLTVYGVEDAETLAQAEESFAALRDGDDDPLGTTMDLEARQRLLAALADVPTLQRDAFLLHVEGGLSLEDIAGLTAASVETVKSRLRYAYRRLRKALEDLQ